MGVGDTDTTHAGHAQARHGWARRLAFLGLLGLALFAAFWQGRKAGASPASVAQAGMIARVDCNAGEKISAALEKFSGTSSEVTIVVTGTCSESVVIDRDDVTLRGNDDDAEIDGDVAVLVTNGASRVRLESLRLKGRFSGLICSYGSAVSARDLTIYGGSRGLSAFYGGVCSIDDSVISRNIQGVTVGDGGSVRMNGSIVEHSVIGINIFTNGTLTLDKSTDYARSIVRKSETGIEISTGGTLRPVSATIEGNKQDGMLIRAGGAVYADDEYIVELKGNGRDAIRVGAGGVLQLTRGFSFGEGGEHGLECMRGATVETKGQIAASGIPATIDAKGACFGG